ncbi:MAG: fibronectin type III domain-containing protein, partial [Candidatus Oxydemutatoraceae bacterium WSBS_2016_MAG_OTU14]
MLNFPTETNLSVVASWNEVANATTYTVNLYLASDASMPIQSESVTGTMHAFIDLDSGTNHIVEVIARAEGYRNSQPGTITATTLKRALPVPRSLKLKLTASSKSITVTSRNAPDTVGVEAEIEEYVINIEPSSELAQALNAIPGSKITFTDLDPRTTYTLTVISSADNTRYINSSEYTTMIRTDYLGNLSTPSPLRVTTVTDESISLSWNGVANATTYTVNLYLASDMRTALQSERVTGTTSMFNNLSFASPYALEVIAQAKNYRESQPATALAVTAKRALPAPRSANLELTASSNSITVTSRNALDTVGTESEIEEYVINIEPSSELAQALNTSPGSEITFANLDPRTTYTLTVISSADNTRYINSDEYTTMIRTDYLGNLSTPSALRVPAITHESISLAWNGVANATTYTVNLYLASDTNTPFRSERVTGTTFMFNSLSLVSSYTLEVIAQADNYRDSIPVTITAMTGKKRLELLTPEQIVVTESTDSATVTFQNTQMGIIRYSVFVQRNFGDNGIAVEETFSIEAMPIVLNNLLPGRRYTLIVSPMIDSDRYIRPTSNYFTSFTTEPVDALSNPTEVTAVIEVRRENAATVSDIRVAWGSVANALGYTVRLYAGADSIGDTPIGDPISVSTPATTTVLGNYPYSQFLTVGVRAVSDIYPNSEEVFTSVLPPKLSSKFFTVTPSSASLSLAWDYSSDADLQDGVNFYDVTRVDNLGDSASSLLRISIEDLNEGEIIEPMGVSTEEGAYSTGGLNKTTNYILKIVQRVAIEDIFLDSEALEISFSTLEELPEPTENEIRWTANETTLTVSWDDVPAGVSSYVLTLTTGEGTPVGTPIEVNARMAGSTTFTSLDAGMTYTLSVVAKGDTSSYAPSPQYRVSVETNELGQLSGPDIMLSLQSSRNIVVSWDGVMNATSYTVNLYSGNDLSNPIGTPITTTGTTHTFDGLSLDLEFGTEYTVGVIAQADNAPNSNERFRSIVTEFFILSAPMGISLSRTINSVIVSWSTVEPALNIETYLLSINPNPNGIEQRAIFVSSSGYTFTGLSEGDEYELSVVSSRD